MNPIEHLTPLFLDEADARSRGMEPHAGPYNPANKSDLEMLEKCVADFRLNPNRLFCLVKKNYVCASKNFKTVERISIWASDYHRTPVGRNYIPIAAKAPKSYRDVMW